MILNMGHQSHDVRATRLKVEMTWMIERAILAALTPFKHRLMILHRE